VTWGRIRRDSFQVQFDAATAGLALTKMGKLYNLALMRTRRSTRATRSGRRTWVSHLLAPASANGSRFLRRCRWCEFGDRNSAPIRRRARPLDRRPSINHERQRCHHPLRPAQVFITPRAEELNTTRRLRFYYERQRNVYDPIRPFFLWLIRGRVYSRRRRRRRWRHGWEYRTARNATTFGALTGNGGSCGMSVWHAGQDVLRRLAAMTIRPGAGSGPYQAVANITRAAQAVTGIYGLRPRRHGFIGRSYGRRPLRRGVVAATATVNGKTPEAVGGRGGQPGNHRLSCGYLSYTLGSGGAGGNPS